jgi:hypothetical protein
MDQETPMSEPSRLHIPLALVVLAFFIMAAFQTVQLIREHGHLADVKLAQEPTIQEGLKLRQQLESLGARTAQLADSGNANAKAIVDELRRQGVTLKPGP